MITPMAWAITAREASEARSWLVSTDCAASRAADADRDGRVLGEALGQPGLGLAEEVRPA
jgi:hypothetical protein